MSLPQRHARRIAVDDQVYRWLLRRVGNSGCCRRCDLEIDSGAITLLVIVEAEDGQGTRAQVSYRCGAVKGALGADSRCCRVARHHGQTRRCDVPAAVTPWMVRWFIKHALAEGWSPQRPGTDWRYHSVAPGGFERVDV